MTRRRDGLTLASAPVFLLGLLAAAIWAAPFLWMVVTSFKPSAEALTNEIRWWPRDPTLENYAKVLEYPILRWTVNSLVVAGVTTALTLYFGAMAGYALARLRFPGRAALFYLFLMSMMIPPEVGVVPLLLAMIQVGWASSYQALILPAVANVICLYIFRQFFLSFPRELEEAAIIDGASTWKIFRKIALPLARAPMIAAGVIVFTLNWNNFLWPLLITFDESMKTLPVGIAAFAPVSGTHTQLEGYSVSMAAATLLSIPSVVLFLILQRYFIAGLRAGAVKG
jgi:multiple sugar transport system permease protein